MTYRVVKSIRSFGYSSVIKHSVLDGIANRDEALQFAELLASEHAARIPTDIQFVSPSFSRDAGYHFMTSNGTDVWYTIENN